MYYRVEDKYIVYEDQIAYIRERLKEFCVRDKNSIDGGYLIRSIYFDDINDSALGEIEAGVDDRSKIRIRSYNADDSFIRLEEKSKKSGFTHKESAVISKETVKGLIEHPFLSQAHMASRYLLSEEGFLFRKVFAGMNSRLLHPVNIVEYEREAFVEKNGNVRITFDRNIGVSTDVGSFFDRNIRAVPTMETGAHIMEVKYDELLPDHIRKIVDLGALQRTSFSKYYYARQIKREMEIEYEFSGRN